MKSQDSSSDSSVSSHEKEKNMRKLLKFMAKDSRFVDSMLKSASKKKRRDNGSPSGMVITRKRSDYSDAMSEASDKRPKTEKKGNNLRNDVVISYDEYLKLKGRHYEENRRPYGVGDRNIPKFGSNNRIDDDMFRGGREHKFGFTHTGAVHRPRYRSDVAYGSDVGHCDTDRRNRKWNKAPDNNHRNRNWNNASGWRDVPRERFRGDRWNISSGDRSQEKFSGNWSNGQQYAHPRKPSNSQWTSKSLGREVYWVSMKKKHLSEIGSSWL